MTHRWRPTATITPLRLSASGRTAAATVSIRYQISGIKIACASPDTPALSAIQPAYRPITSATIRRRCGAAVGCNRSMHSVAKDTAVSARLLSMVLGTPTTRRPFFFSALAMRSKPSPLIATSASRPSRQNARTRSALRSFSTTLLSLCRIG